MLCERASALGDINFRPRSSVNMLIYIYGYSICSQIKKSLVDAAEQSSEVMVRNLGLEDGKEGLAAFLEKRHPTWQQDK